MVKMSHYFRDWGQPTLTIDWVSIWGQDKLGENPKHSESGMLQLMQEPRATVWVGLHGYTGVSREACAMCHGVQAPCAAMQ
jgi:hypothetical protein